jgi:hypothetical protein
LLALPTIAKTIDSILNVGKFSLSPTFKMLRRRRFVDGMVVALIVEKQFDAGGRHENQ